MFNRTIQYTEDSVVVLVPGVIPHVDVLLQCSDKEVVIRIDDKRAGSGVTHQFASNVIADGIITERIDGDEVMPVEEPLYFCTPTYFVFVKVYLYSVYY